MFTAASSNSASRGSVWLVRHGESTWNVQGLVQGHRDDPVLTKEGRRQAADCARQLAGLPVTAVFTSDLRRASATAGPIARALGLDAAVDTRLRERHLGEAEGLPTTCLGPEWSGIAGGVVVDADAAPPGGESVRQHHDRAVSFLVEILDAGTDGDLVVVCHGGTVRVLLAWLDGVEPSAMQWPALPNATIAGRPVPPTGRPAMVGAAPPFGVLAAHGG
jgi:probable phosphoglycerate mutase